MSSAEKVAANSGHSDEVRATNCYPHVFPVSATHSEFPNNAKAFEAVGMPVGCLAKVFIPNADRSQLVYNLPRYFDNATNIARCATCGAYLNPYCDATSQRWYCALCGARNSITRSMARYKQLDVRSLPESTEVVLDFPMPYRDIDGAPPAYIGEMGVVAPERPLVHVFLVQENMPVDAMQAVVEALTASFNAMHPEIQIVLLTFSNRIGIHRFSEQPGDTAHTVQYVHMGDSQGDGGIFEGHDLHGAVSNNSTVLAGSIGGSGLSQIGITMPLSVASDFLSLACPVGACKDAAVSALSSLFDPVYSPEGVGPGAGFDRSSFETVAVPQVMIGPVLEAVQSWIIDPDESEELNPWEEADVARRSAVAASAASAAGAGAGLSSNGVGGGGGGTSGGLFGMLRDLGMSIIGGEIEDDSELDFVTGVRRRRKRGGSMSQASSGMTTTGDGTDGSSEATAALYERGAIDFCSGVILHVMVSSPQDLPPGSHDSVGYPLLLGGPGSTPLTAPPIDTHWAQSFARKCGLRSLCVNLWAVCSFEGQGVGLQQLAPIANLTGGTINRCILGAFPSDQRARLTEMLVRSVTKQYACKAVMKMRTSTGVDIEGDCPTGPLCPDPELPGIGRIAACSPDATFGFNFNYKSDSAASIDSRGGAIIAQIAFSYETLVETTHTLPTHERKSGGTTAGNGSSGGGSKGASRRGSATVTVSSNGTGTGTEGEDWLSEGEGGGYSDSKNGDDGDDDDLFGDDEDDARGRRAHRRSHRRSQNRRSKQNRNSVTRGWERGSTENSRRNSQTSSIGDGDKKRMRRRSGTSSEGDNHDNVYEHEEGDDDNDDEVTDYWKTAVEALELKQQVMAVKHAVESRHDRNVNSGTPRGKTNSEKMRTADGDRLRENFRWNPKAPAVSKFARARSFRESSAELEALQLLIDPSNLTSGEKDICCYDRKKQLVAVRRLRIITIMIESAPTIPRLIQSVDPATLSLIIARYAFLNDLRFSSASSKHSASSHHHHHHGSGTSALGSVFGSGTMTNNASPVVHDGATGASTSDRHAAATGRSIAPDATLLDSASGDGDSGLSLLHDWAVSAISSCAKLGVVFTESGKERAAKPLSSMTAIEKQELLLAISRSPIYLRLLQLLCGASDLLATHTSFLAGIALANKAKTTAGKQQQQQQSSSSNAWTMQRFLAEGDAAAEMNSIIQSMDAYTCQSIFYPELLPVSLLSSSSSSSSSSKQLPSSPYSSDGVCAILGQYENFHDDPKGGGTTVSAGRMPTEMDGLPGVRDGTLPLRREALITSGAQAFYLDAGTEIVMYRTVSSSVFQGGGGGGGGKDRNEPPPPQQQQQQQQQFQPPASFTNSNYPSQPVYGPPPQSAAYGPPATAPPPPPPPPAAAAPLPFKFAPPPPMYAPPAMPPLGPPTTITTSSSIGNTAVHQQQLDQQQGGVPTAASGVAAAVPPPTSGTVASHNHPPASSSGLAAGLTVDMRTGLGGGGGSAARPQLNRPLHSSPHSVTQNHTGGYPANTTSYGSEDSIAHPAAVVVSTEISYNDQNTTGNYYPPPPMPPPPPAAATADAEAVAEAEAEESSKTTSDEQLLEEMEKKREREEKVLRSRLRNWNWLPNDLRRRLRVSSIVPVVHAAEAGTASANLLSQHLLDDCAKSMATTRPAKSPGDNVGYRAFLKEVMADAMDVLKSR